MKRFVIVIFCLFCAFSAFSQNETAEPTDVSSDGVPHKETVWQKYLRPNHILDITIEPGAGVYVGKFYQTLREKGAYIATPTFDLYLSLFIIRYFGMQALLSSGCVIHPYSTEPEGTMLYMAIECFGIYEWKYVYLKAFAGVGYEHPTWFLSKYASGFFEGGAGIGIKVTDYLAITTSCKYRMGFLHVVELMWKGERLMSMTASIGVTCRIANRMK
jgi:hypothetical protein